MLKAPTIVSDNSKIKILLFYNPDCSVGWRRKGGFSDQ